MERILIRLLIITSSCSFSAKHVYIQTWLTWSAAQRYCRENHTDLSPITNDLEEKVFRESVGEGKEGWIGLHLQVTRQMCRWSGGTYATNEERVTPFFIAVKWTSGEWFSTFGWYPSPFFCLNLIVVQEEKTWNEALDHCRQTHASLTSLLSWTENRLAQTEIEQSDIIKGVWIGLRYQEGSWEWVNGDPLEYEAWTHGGDQDHLSPTKRLCGVLTNDGKWVNSDCEESRPFICA